MTTISFDIAALELFLPLMAGARVFVCDRQTAADGRALAQCLAATDADWTELKISASELDAQIRNLRRWLTDPRQRFDPALAYKIYQATFAAFADKIAARKLKVFFRD